ncbi:MAG: hypothetical protein Q8M16_17695 [Pirellulaceae bacterium]|nr:hypothetical protein [Pirellulaceae bacterium]
MLPRAVVFLLLTLVGTLPQIGCTSHPLSPRHIPLAATHLAPKVIDDAPQIQRGQPRPIIDGIGWVVGIPSKLILWDRRVDNHRIGLDTEQALAEYIAENQLDGVRVRLNQYRPGEDWVRLVRNKSVGPGWRYTLGTLSVLGETVFPGRVFGGDHYNPFTNTVHVYSDIPAVALHEGAHAKDFARREWKGTYGALYLLPIVPLYHESVATGDVFAYLEEHSDSTERAEAAKILYPAYGTYAGSAAGSLVSSYSNPLYWVGLGGGHVAGRIEADRILREAANEPSTQFASPASYSEIPLQQPN